MAGEKSGNLSGVLDQYIAYQRTSNIFISRLKNILIYPAILVSMLVIVLSYLVTFAVPKFADLYSQLNVELPLSTRIVLAVLVPLRQYIFEVIGVVALVVTLFYWWLQSDTALW